MDNLITLSVGDEYHLRSGKDNIVYAGMPLGKVYSIVQRKRKFAPYTAWGFAWNLFSLDDLFRCVDLPGHFFMGLSIPRNCTFRQSV